MINLLLILVFLFAPHFAQAKTTVDLETRQDTIIKILVEPSDSLIVEQTDFYGLSSYYNHVNYYIVSNDGILSLSEGDSGELSSSQWLAAAGRFNVLLIKATGLSFNFIDSRIAIQNPEKLSAASAVTKVVDKSTLPSIAPELDQIRYAHLWAPLAWLTKIIESSLVAIQAYLGSNWGLAIVTFSVLLKTLLLPVGVMTVRLQRRVSQLNTQLAPKLASIKANYDGEEAHIRLMSAYKDLGVTPFYTLKPMLGSFIQIPILISVFNALGEMPQLAGQSFLWIEDLAYPDAIGHLSFSMPIFGTSISLLPFFMTAITIFSTIIYKNNYATEVELRRQKRNLYLMASLFFILFYPFPAAMVLYWSLVNVLQTIQQQIVRA